jgi:hemolysin activation/secretion protein
VSGYVSPGGLSARNRGRYFDASRAGAKAQYAYGKINLVHQRALGRGFSWQTAIEAQVANGALLGTEQLNGGGSAAVRGYRESSAFGDWGVVANNELHLPALKFGQPALALDAFAFFDFASLGLHEDDSMDLQSAGVGFNGQFSQALNVRAAIGWPLKTIATNAGDRSARGHVSANLSF